MKDFSYTILIPHHNIPILLKRCLDSIPKRKDLQIIVVDDCSTEDCKWVETYSEDWGEILLIENKEPKGAGHARNVGLDYVKGERLIFADCDDFFLENFSLILDKYKSTDYDLIFFNARSVYSDDLKKEAIRANRVQEYIEKNDLLKLRYNFTEPWCKIIKTSIVSDNYIRFDETIVANDYIFSINIGLFSRKIIVEKTEGYVVTLRSQSLSSSFQSVEKLLVRIGVSRRAYDFFYENNINCEEPYLGSLMCALLKLSPKQFLVVFSKMIFNGDIGQIALFFRSLLKKLIL